MNDKDDLTRALQQQADVMSGNPITLDDVKGRATRIRRRRAAVAVAGVAAVAAIAVPTAVAVLQDPAQTPEPAPAPPTPTVTIDRMTPEEQGKPLDVDDLERGDEPAITWRDDQTWHLAGKTLELDRRYDWVVPWDDGLLAAANDDDGNPTAYVLTGDGVATDESFPTAYDVAVSDDLSQVLVVRDDRLVLHNNSTRGEAVVHQGSAVMEPVSVLGDTAYYNVADESGTPDGRRWTAGSEYDVRPGSLFRISDVTPDGWDVGVVSVRDDGSCSEVVVPESAVGGRTCRFTPDAFSPDGLHLLAGPAYRDGYGDGVLAVLDRNVDETTSTVVRHYVQSGERDATFLDTAWEDATHVLAVTATPTGKTSPEGNGLMRFQIVRIGLDGSIEDAVEPVEADEFEIPFALQP